MVLMVPHSAFLFHVVWTPAFTAPALERGVWATQKCGGFLGSLPMVVFGGGVNSRATIASAFLVRSVVTSDLRVVPGTGLTFPGAVDVGSSANCRSERKAFCRIAISCAMEVWLDICELQDGNPAVGQKVSRLLGREGLDRIPNSVKRVRAKCRMR